MHTSIVFLEYYKRTCKLLCRPPYVMLLTAGCSMIIKQLVKNIYYKNPETIFINTTFLLTQIY